MSLKPLDLLKTGDYKRDYVPVADGFRVLCVLFVAWFHIWQQSWLSPVFHIGPLTLNLMPLVRAGYMMVDLLLLLSGFLLFLPYAKTLLTGSPLPDVKTYYKKRVLRILPSYYFCVILTFFTYALPQYGSVRSMLLDLVGHLTFTHNLAYESYIGTKFTGVLWTLAVEVQFYLIAPLVGRAFVKKPILTYIAMTAAAFFYRFVYVHGMNDTSLFFNRLPAMLDVYANGMAAAWLYMFLKKRMKPSLITSFAGLVLSIGALAGIYLITAAQARVYDYEAIRWGQMAYRFPLTLLGGVFLVAGSQAPRLFQWLFNNPVMRFGAMVSYNFYIWHAQLMLRLRSWHIPPYESDMPQSAGEQPWQTQYTILCFIVAFAAAVLLTFLIEKPAAKAGARLMEQAKKRGKRSRKRKSDVIS